MSMTYIESKQNEIEDLISELLKIIEEDTSSREGLVATPTRVAKSYNKLFGGYYQKPEDILKPIFYEEHDEMILLKDIEFYSTCEHHILPFFGLMHIAYIPGKISIKVPNPDYVKVTAQQLMESKCVVIQSKTIKKKMYKVVGISKLARLVECFARRLQIQERLCRQIGLAINEILKPQGVAVCIEAQHFCMTSRGIEKQKSKMVTSFVKGVFREKDAARKEFFDLIK